MSSTFAQRKAALLVDEGRLAVELGDRPRALEAFRRAIALDDDHVEARVALADALADQGDLIEAAATLGRAVELADDDGLREELALLWVQIGRPASAERLARALLDRYPGQVEPRVTLAVALRRQRHWAALEAVLDELERDPPDGADLSGLRREIAAARRLNRNAQTGAPPETVRERVLARHGSIVLGTAHDDGVHLPWYSTYLCTHEDVVVTVGRFAHMAEHFGWRYEAVVPVEPAAEVLAVLLSSRLGLPLRRLGQAEPSQSLGVAAVLEPGWEHQLRGPAGEPSGGWAQTCADGGRLFAFAALHYASPDMRFPPVVGLVGGERICVPWWRLAEARVGFSPDGLIESLPDEIDARPPEVIARPYLHRLAQWRAPETVEAQLRHATAHLSELQSGLQVMSVPRIPRVGNPATSDREPAARLLDTDDPVAQRAALARLESQHPEARADLDELAALEALFRREPDRRSRVADVLYRCDPARFADFLEQQVAAAATAPDHERDQVEAGEQAA